MASPQPQAPAAPSASYDRSHPTRFVSQFPQPSAAAAPSSPANPPPTCHAQGCSNPPLFVCSQCPADSPSKAHYCSQQCQSSDWPLHRNVCRSVADFQHSSLPASGGSRFGRWDLKKFLTSFSKPRVATINNQHAMELSDSNNPQIRADETENFEEASPEDVKFYTKQIYLITIPVVYCIILAIVWVKLTVTTSYYFDTGPSKSPLSSTAPTFNLISVAVGYSSGNASSSVILALTILAQVVVATVVIVFLFKFGCFKILYGIFTAIVLLLLGFFGYTLSIQLLTKFNLAIDYITLAFCLWNFTVVGLALIFYKGPLRLQQVYLVVMSSMMSFSLTSQLPSLATWILLALLAVWDLIAVLCPYGPLRMLIESSQTQNQEIPALLYTVMIWMMATPPDPSLIPSNNQPDVDTVTIRTTASMEGDRQTLTAPYASQSLGQSANNINGAEDDEDDEERSGMKLGLGDFVFYSVLISKAAYFDWITTISCTVAVMTGLNMTIFLLVLYRKALPALPISIAFGLVFYFVASITLVPMTVDVLNFGSRVAPVDVSALWLGKSGGAGMVFI
ncbi:Presenilin-1 [Nowakowskiella sp. JEL0078]|nr:Presenilin-1 [Nowakowskiella sp. JEL0078]